MTPYLPLLIGLALLSPVLVLAAFLIAGTVRDWIREWTS